MYNLRDFISKPNIINESLGINLKDDKEITKLGSKLQKEGFPVTFEVDYATKLNGIVTLHYKLSNKEINDDPDSHEITFTYELESTSSKLLNSFVKAANELPATEDPDSEKYDLAVEDSYVDELKIQYELNKPNSIIGYIA